MNASQSLDGSLACVLSEQVTPASLRNDGDSKALPRAPQIEGSLLVLEQWATIFQATTLTGVGHLSIGDVRLDAES